MFIIRYFGCRKLGRGFFLSVYLDFRKKLKLTRETYKSGRLLRGGTNCTEQGLRWEGEFSLSAFNF